VFADLYFVLCYYGTTSFIETNGGTPPKLARPFSLIICFRAWLFLVIGVVVLASGSCDSGKWIALPIISCLPLWWRFQQCMKRYFETRQAWPHLANAFKYALSHTVVIMGMFH
jgi:predicted membrane chloride channel (bestrophin family)